MTDPNDPPTEGAPNDEVLTDGNVGADADLSTGDEADDDALNQENATNPE
jgi:hypothetical protein